MIYQLIACRPITDPTDRRLIFLYERAAMALLVLYFALGYVQMHQSKAVVQIPLGILCGILFFGFSLACSLLTYRCLDEFQRQLLIKSFVWGALLTAALASVAGHIEMIDPNFHIPLIAFPEALIFLSSAIKVLIFRKHKAPAA